MPGEKIFVNMKSFQEIQELDDFSNCLTAKSRNPRNPKTLNCELKSLNPKELTSSRCNNLSIPKMISPQKQIS
jgi:hypothetical protein